MPKTAHVATGKSGPSKKWKSDFYVKSWMFVF